MDDGTQLLQSLYSVSNFSNVRPQHAKVSPSSSCENCSLPFRLYDEIFRMLNTYKTPRAQNRVEISVAFLLIVQCCLRICLIISQEGYHANNCRRIRASRQTDRYCQYPAGLNSITSSHRILQDDDVLDRYLAGGQGE
jgi:hypothetical protein